MNDNITSWESKVESLTKKIHDWCGDKHFFADKIQQAKSERARLKKLINAHQANKGD